MENYLIRSGKKVAEKTFPLSQNSEDNNHYLFNSRQDWAMKVSFFADNLLVYGIPQNNMDNLNRLFAVISKTIKGERIKISILWKPCDLLDNHIDIYFIAQRESNISGEMNYATQADRLGAFRVDNIYDLMLTKKGDNFVLSDMGLSRKVEVNITGVRNQYLEVLVPAINSYTDNKIDIHLKVGYKFMEIMGKESNFLQYMVVTGKWKLAFLFTVLLTALYAIGYYHTETQNQVIMNNFLFGISLLYFFGIRMYFEGYMKNKARLYQYI